MKTFGLIGKNIGHSLSAAIHERLYPFPYRLFDIDEIDRFMANTDLSGVNVTHPYKRRILEHCAMKDDTVENTGAANTLVKTASGFKGFNTDFIALKHLFSTRLERSDKVAVIGGGATGATAVAALRTLGFEGVLVYARRPVADQQPLERIHERRDITVLVNATPVGMYPDVDSEHVLDFDVFDRLRFAFDLVYAPLRTNFLIDAEAHGVSSLNGLSTLFMQALAAGAVFHGEAPREDPCTLFEDIYSNTANIVLIGPPLVGKTHIGKALADHFGKPFHDTDASLENTYGSDIFDLPGSPSEHVFRALENTVLRRYSEERGAVIACGGGAILCENGIRALRRSGIIVWLDGDHRHIDADTKGKHRFLRRIEDVEKLYRERRERYRAFADITVQPGTSTQDTLDRIGGRLDAHIGTQRTELESFGHS